MPKLSPIRARELIAILEKLGFEKAHQKGSHVRMKHVDGRRTSVPLHSAVLSRSHIRCDMASDIG